MANSRVKIQLLEINKGYLDVGSETVFPLNYAIGDVRDLSKRTGTFSKTITIPGTKNNHKLLNNYFEVNITEGTFDVKKKQPCVVIENGTVILENCYLQLLSVNRTKDDISYSVCIKDTSADFFQAINGKELTDLDFSDLNHVLTAAFVQSTFTNTVANGFKYGLSENPDNDYYFIWDMLPMFYEKTIFDRIFQRAGYRYTWSSLAANKFDKLLIPHNGDEYLVDPTTYENEKVVINRTAFTSTFNQAPGNNIGFTNNIQAPTEIQDINNRYNPATFIYTNPFNITSPNKINVRVDIDFTMRFNNTSGATAYISNNANTFQSNRWFYNPLFIVKKGTTAVAQGVPYLYGSIPSRTIGFSVPAGTTTLQSGVVSLNMDASNLNAGDQLTFFAGISVSQQAFGANFPINWRSASPTGGAQVQVNPELVINSITVTLVPSVNSLVSGATINMNKYVPKKIKQSDFVKSIFQKYNLYVEVDQYDSRLLVIKTRDEYYDGGTEKDFTKKFALDIDHTIQFLPEVISKRFQLSAKDDKDPANELYKNITSETYGQIEYVFESDFVRDTQRNELIFSPTPFTDTIFGAKVPMISGRAPKNNIRYLYDGGMFPCQTWFVYDYQNLNGTFSGVSNTTYPLTIHLDKPQFPTLDINFGVCDFYYSADLGLTNNNFYNKYWRRTLGQMNSGKLLTGKFHLTEVDVNTMKLSDRWCIGNTKWNINKVIDYDANSTELTTVELISIDDEVIFAPFQTKLQSGIKPPDVKKFLPAYKDSNINTKGAKIQGNQNIANASGDIIGSSNIMQKESIIVGDNNIVLSSSMVLGDNNVIPENLENVMVIGNGQTPTKSNSLSVENLFTENLFIAPAALTPVRITTTTPILVLSTDYTIEVQLSNTTLNFPTAVGLIGKIYEVKQIAGVVGTILNPVGGEFIDGAATKTLRVEQERMKIQSDGANWIVLNEDMLQPNGTKVSATANTTTTSATDVVMNSMTFTLPAGTYAIDFGTTLNSNTNDSNVFASIYVNGVQIAESQKQCRPQFATDLLSSASIPIPIALNAEVTVNGAQAIDIRWRITGGGTATANQRTMNAIRLSK